MSGGVVDVFGEEAVGAALAGQERQDRVECGGMVPPRLR
jgi:hypothetical protein